MTKPFVHLHNHSSYSVLDGAAKIDDMVEAAVRDGAPALGVTDHGVLYGLPEFYRACKSADINPVLGCEVYFADDRTDKSTVGEGSNIDGTNKRYYHLTILAKDNTGYQNLMKLSSDAYLNGMFYKPRTDWSTLEQYSDGLIATSGCLGGPVLQKIMNNDISGAENTVARLYDIFGADNFFIEIQDQGLPEQAKTNPVLMDIAKPFGIPLVATNDSHYVNHRDAVPHDALLCVQTGAHISDTDRFKFSSDQHYLKSAEEMRHIFQNVSSACDNTLAIAERANVKLDFDTLHLPHFEIPEQFESEGKYLAALALRGLEKRYGTPTPNTLDRLQYELSTVEALGLSAYFLIVWDICRFADQNGVARGPGRGSVAGSLIAYCMNISKVDPMRHDLLFERFLNPNRIAMPDIDLDFSPRDREKVINYITEKYGRDQVSQIVTFSTIKAKSAIRDSARVLGHPHKLGDTIAKMVPEAVMGEDTPLWSCFEETERYGSRYEQARGIREFYSSDADAKEVIDVALGLEGLVRGTGTGAAGLLITPGPVTDFVPVQLQGKKGDEKVVTQYDKNICEDLGLVKMDILGLRNLDVISDTIHYLDAIDKVDVDSEEFKQFDDGKTFELLRTGDTVGVFQLESGPMADLLMAVNPQSIDDIAAVNALYRPGPMGTGMHYDYADRKNGRADSSVFHPDAQDILDYTYGLMIYQEQAMQLAVRFAGYTEGEADSLRKIIGKKLVDKMAAEKANFVQGCINTGYGAELGEQLFNMIESFASYGFNKSHAYAYGYISYQTAYLKANYPVQYMAALCDSVAGDTGSKCAIYLNEAKNMGINIECPNVNKAEVEFAPHGNSIVVGLDAVKHLSHVTAESIVRERKEKPFESVKDFVTRVELDVRELQFLTLAGGLDDFGTRLGIHSAANEILTEARRIRTGEKSKQIALFDNVDYWDIEIPTTEFDYMTKLHHEKDGLGLYVTGNPLAELQDYHTGINLDELRKKGDILVVVMDAAVKKTRAGQEMAIVTVTDGLVTKEVIAFPKNWGEVGHKLTPNACGVMEIVVRKDSVTENMQYVCLGFFPVTEFEKDVPDAYDTIKFRAPRGFASNEKAVSKLKGILISHPGNHPVEIQVSAKTCIDLKSDFRIDWNDQIKEDIGELFRRYSADKKMKQ